MTDRVRITDVAPRDGLQNERGVVPTADKLRLVASLIASGVDEVEVTSFVSPRWVPQLGDAAELLTLVRERKVSQSPPLAPPASGRGIVFSALVPNTKGFEAARAFHSADFPLKIAVFTAASETFSKNNTNATIDETIERFAAFLPDAFSLGMEVRGYISCAVACPFEGEIRPDAVRRVADKLVALAPSPEAIEIDLGETIGVAQPADIAALLSEFTDDERSRLTLHLHDTRGHAGECVRTAIEMGVRSFDGAVAGLGGCPYASTPDKPAPGNLATETLVRVVREAGLTPGLSGDGVNDDALRDAAAIAREIKQAAGARA